MSILKKPLITEKVTAQNENGVYGFVVDRNANKVAIKQAVEKMYGVNVEAVRTMVAPGKKKTRYSKGAFLTGKTSAFKKAIVKVKDGEIIDFYSNL